MSPRTRNLNIAELVAQDTAHHLHPFTDHKSLHAEGGARIITHAQGAWVWDARGEKLFDAMSGLWCVNVGYGRKELAEAAYRQMLELPYYNTFFKTSTVPATELAARVASLLPDHINSVFFVNSGSEANDTIVRLLRYYWALKGQPERQVFIGRHRAYHGSTMASASLGGMPTMHGQGGLPLPGFEHVMQPDWFSLGGDMSPDEFGLKAAREIEARIRKIGPDRIAGVIGEPIQGAGGVIIPPATYWPEVERICRAHGIPLIADEVICGFGRTGNWWGFETFGFSPDIVPMAKGLSSGYLPIGAVAVSDAIMKEFIELGGEFFHGYTYSGHPAACAVALENIRIIEDERLVERVRDLAPTLKHKMTALADHPLVGEVRTCGFIGAIELVRDKAARTRFEPEGRVGVVARDLCVANGIIMRACWDTLVFAPPFPIGEADMDHWVERARRALDQTYDKVKHEMTSP
jgi:putrescine aminotransferase